MISNDPKQHDYHQGPESPPKRPSVPEDTLARLELQIERKSFLLILKQNSRGRFLRITEYVGDRSNSIIVPAAGLLEFQKLLAEMTQAASEIPPKDQAPQP